MISHLSFYSTVSLFETPRRRCPTPPLSPEPCCHACCRPALTGRCLVASRSARWQYCSRAPVGAASPLRSRQSLARTAHCPQFLLVDAWRYLLSLDGVIVRELPSVLPRLSALARASLPCLLSSSSCWSILGGLSARSIENCFESSRRRCLAPPPSSEPSLPCLRSPRSYWLMFDGFIDSLDAIIV